MMKKTSRILISALLTLVMLSGLVMPGIAAEAKSAKNVILMIADGGGFNELLAADYYLYGAAGASLQEGFPVALAMSTYSFGKSKATTDDLNSVYSPEFWKDTSKFLVGYTDSAAAATAMSTGTKTYDAAIGVDQSGSKLTHISEDFEALGRSTGVVTSVPFNHATPAGFVAHNGERNNYTELADEMIKNSATDVIMGTGNPLFNDDGAALTAPKYSYISKESWEALTAGTIETADANGDGKADPWTLIQTKDEFTALQTGTTPERLIGIAQVGTTLQEYRTMSGSKSPAFQVPFNTGVPDLPTMTNGALNVLDNNKNGFFLMIEGGAVDWAGHYGQTGREIEEMADFIKAVAAVNAWVEKNSSWDDTLLIVTADHETGFLSGSKTELTDVTGNGKDMMPTMFYNSGGHSNQLVPFFAKGAGCEQFKLLADLTDTKRGNYLDNTEISRVVRNLIGKGVSDLSDWAVKDVGSAIALGIVPDNLQMYYQSNITRENFCALAYQMLVKAAGTKLMTPTADKPMPFTDTTSDMVYTLNQLGIINGITKTQFGPDKLLTREEAATILGRLATYMKKTIPETAFTFADDAKLSSWAKESVYDMYALGIMKGVDASNFAPKTSYSLQMAIVTMLRLYNS